MDVIRPGQYRIPGGIGILPGLATVVGYQRDAVTPVLKGNDECGGFIGARYTSSERRVLQRQDACVESSASIGSASHHRYIMSVGSGAEKPSRAVIVQGDGDYPNAVAKRRVSGPGHVLGLGKDGEQQGERKEKSFHNVQVLVGEKCVKTEWWFFGVRHIGGSCQAMRIAPTGFFISMTVCFV